MSGPGYGSWNWTLIYVNVWQYLLTKKRLIKNIFYIHLVNELQKVSEEKDIEVYIDSSLKFELNVAKKIKKANRMIVLIKRNFNYLDKYTFLTLYKALVRLHLEYGNRLSVSGLHTK